MTIRGPLGLVTTALIVSVALGAPAFGADWPAHRYDGARSAVSPEQLKTSLHLQWTYAPAHAPQPAWPEPGRELNRTPFDYAYQVSAAHGLVYFGSSADHKVYALDLATGEERWSFFTGGPIRFAPAVEGDRVFVASDDGSLYCLSAAEGKLLWRFFAGPRQEKLMGNEQMISRWPLRSGVVVEDGIVCFTAGMWPAETVYAYALRAEDGTVIWKNNTSGQMYLPQPHPPSVAMTGVTPQGYMVAHGGRLFVPTGRNVPAAYDAETGKLLYYHSRPNTWGNRWGGSWAFASGGRLFNWLNHVGPDIDVRAGESKPWPKDGLVVFDCETGKVKRELIGKLRAVVKDDILYTSGAGKVTAFDFKALMGGAKPDKCTKWETPHERAYELIMAGDTLLVGGQDTVTAIGAAKGKALWKSAVEGQARGLAAADGRVLVSTSTGQIACFGPEQVADPPVISPKAEPSPYEGDDSSAAARMAQRIIEKTGVTSGFCLALGAGDCRLAYELAKRTDLKVWCLEADAQKVEAARQALDAASVYGARVVVHQGSLRELPYPDYFADLIVMGDGTARGLPSCSAGELHRVLRPCGGTAYLGFMGSRRGWWAKRIRDWLSDAKVPSVEVRTCRGFVRVVRRDLPGAGDWTHQYADIAQTGASDDQLVRLPMKLLWFGEPGPAMMVARHWGGPAPLCVGGRLFVIGQFRVTAVDAYNGRELWSRDLPRAGRFHVSSKGGNAAADEDSVYIAAGKTCLRLDAATGETVREYRLPPPPDSLPEEAAEKLEWTYLGVTDDLVLGTEGNPGEARRLFAIDKDDGELRWVYAAEESVHFGAVAAGDGVVYLIDRPTAGKLGQLKRRGEDAFAKWLLVALDASTGDTIWKTDRGLTHRTDLRLAKGVLVATGGGRMSAYSADTGRMLSWSGATMRRFPVIIGDTIHGEPYAYDLRTGKRKMRVHPLTGKEEPWMFSRSYGCGATSAAPAMLMFRSGTLGFYDLAGDSGTHNYGGVRAGCWTNAIAAAGLLLMPPADATCTCSYSLRTTIALAPTTKHEEWGIFAASAVKPGTRIRQLTLNLGALGDKRDAKGNLWLGFPRKGGLAVPVKAELSDQGGYYQRNADEMLIAGTDAPWLYTSGAEGLRTATVELGTAETQVYTVRLHFAELKQVEPGQRVFDVKLQDEIVLDGLDVAKQAGGRNVALVKTITGVSAAETLKLELIPRAEEGKQIAEPIISAIEVRQQPIRTR